MHTHHTRQIVRPVLIGATALAVLVVAGWAAHTWPEVKHLATLAGIGILAAMCSLSGLAALLLHLFGNKGSQPPAQPQPPASASRTGGTR
jgi:thiol:disulfide interchange protein